jgi:phosphoesterase RecJ-like protein
VTGVPLTVLAERLAGADDVFVFTHEFADGDALGSVVALVLFLRAMGKDVQAFVPGKVQRAYRFLDTDALLNTMTMEQGIERCSSRHVTCLSADAAEASRLGEWRPLFERGAERLVIDHHATNAGFGDAYLVDGEASSCCEVILELFETMGSERISTPVATALYAGLVADTGSFQFANTGAPSLIHGARLINLGASPDDVSRSIYEARPYGNVRLMASSLCASRLLYAGQVVLSYVTRGMLEESGALDEDTEGITDELRRIEGTRAVVLLKETRDDSIKVSLRGKYGFDVKRVATAFGGGGHLLAAGCTVQGDLAAAEELVLLEFDRYLGPSRT